MSSYFEEDENQDCNSKPNGEGHADPSGNNLNVQSREPRAITNGQREKHIISNNYIQKKSISDRFADHSPRHPGLMETKHSVAQQKHQRLYGVVEHRGHRVKTVPEQWRELPKAAASQGGSQPPGWPW